MNETMIDLQRYVDEVRRGLADLDPETCEELTECLAADLADLVAERGADVLPAPGVYAAELRAAAGLAPSSGRVRERAFARALTDSLDAAHAHWDRLLDDLPVGGPRGFLTAVQPVWWVMRAWVAWMVAQDLRRPSVELNAPWIAVLVLFVVASVQLGRRSWGVDRLLTASVVARLLLVALNLGAVAALPGAVDRAANQIAMDRGEVYWGEPWYESAAPPDPTAS